VCNHGPVTSGEYEPDDLVEEAASHRAPIEQAGADQEYRALGTTNPLAGVNAATAFARRFGGPRRTAAVVAVAIVLILLLVLSL
jgi:hypothetical protein